MDNRIDLVAPTPAAPPRDGTPLERVAHRSMLRFYAERLRRLEERARRHLLEIQAITDTAYPPPHGAPAGLDLARVRLRNAVDELDNAVAAYEQALSHASDPSRGSGEVR